MAKVALSKLGLKTNNDVQLLPFGEGEIEVRSYLPIQEKIELISNIVNQSVDENGYWNPIRVKVFMTLEIMYAYTNINFTDKMKENIFKTYDLIVSTGLFDKVLTCILPSDWQMIQDDTLTTIKNIYEFKNSAMGVLETVSTDYSDLNLDAQNIQKALGDPENLTLLKDVMTRLG